MKTSTSNELYHYGVLGMKWGIRRYQPYGQGYSPKNVGREIGDAAKAAEYASKYKSKQAAKVYDSSMKKIEKYSKKGLESKVEQGKKLLDLELAAIGNLSYDDIDREQQYKLNRGIGAAIVGDFLFGFVGGAATVGITNAVSNKKLRNKRIDKEITKRIEDENEKVFGKRDQYSDDIEWVKDKSYSPKVNKMIDEANSLYKEAVKTERKKEYGLTTSKDVDKAYKKFNDLSRSIREQIRADNKKKIRDS